MLHKKCEQLFETLQQQINSGQMKRGDRLPSEKELCDSYDMSRQVVREAIQLLRDEGLVETVKGSGTYVKDDAHGRDASSTISVILPYDDDYIFGSFISGIHSTLTKFGYNVEIHISHNNPYEEENALTSVLNNSPAGIIIDPAKSLCPRLHTELYNKIIQLKIPCLSINCRVPGFDFPVVSMNDVSSGHIATRYLLAKGHTHIGFLCNVDSSPGQLRLKGYLCEMGSAGLSDQVCHTINYSTEDEQELFSGSFDSYILNRLAGCTAVVCFNDRIAVKLIHFLQLRNFKIPQDISVIGHDGSLMSDYVTPRLTTVKHLKTNLGMIAAENIVHLIKKPHFDANRIIEPEIIERDSVLQLDV